jgi:murein peptide amidase A
VLQASVRVRITSRLAGWRSRGVWVLVVVAGLGVGLAGAAGSIRGMRPAAGPFVVRHVFLGRSVRGRLVRAVEVGDPSSSLRVVVVGCIDGNECAGIAIARVLEEKRPQPGIDLWIVENMNPDGFEAGTLQNPDGVDLNRNFPWRWRPLGSRGDWQYSGRRPLSEPESRIMRSLLLRLRPRLVIWYHQPLGVVDKSGGQISLERRYAQLVGLPLVRLPRYPGSATSWADQRFPGATSFVVELPPGPLSSGAARRHADAVLALSRRLRARAPAK